MKQPTLGITSVILSFLLTLCFAAASTAQQNANSKAGTITRVSPSLDTISVKLDDDGTTETYTIDDGTDVTFRGSRRAVEDLSPGDRVILEFDEDTTNASRRARRVAQGDVDDDRTAEVLGVNLADDQLTVRFVDDNEVETYQVSPDVDIWIRNNPGSLVRNRVGGLDDIHVGDEVVLDFDEINRDQTNRPTLRVVTYGFTIDENEPDTRFAAADTRVGGSRLPNTASIFPALGLTGVLFITIAGWARVRRNANPAKLR